MSAVVRNFPSTPNDDDWEVFERRTAGRLRNHLRVGIDKTGTLGLSPMALDALGGQRSVLVLIGRRTRHIALKGATGDDPRAFKVSPGTRQIHMPRPLLELGYDFTAGRSWVTPQVDGDLLIIDLADAEANRKGQS